MNLNIIFNRDNKNNIGIDGGLIYHIKDDLDWFKSTTIGHIVVMGYNTWVSLPKKPLNKRINIVISNNHYDELISQDKRPDIVYRSFSEFMDKHRSCNHTLDRSTWPEYIKDYHETFIIGGASLYEEAYKVGVDFIYETKCEPSFNITNHWHHTLNPSLVKSNIVIGGDYVKIFNKPCHGKARIYTNQNPSEKHERSSVMIDYSFNIYQNKLTVNKGEQEYLRLLNSVYCNGFKRDTRNSQVISSFGEKMSFDLRKGFPLLTTKKMGWKTILRELLWFISGSTNNKELQKKNVHIWDGNSSKEYMDSRGLDYDEGDLGPIYGYQWRNFGGEYNKSESIGFDQLRYMIDLIKNDPTSRRIIMSAWNPPDLDKMALPPCHILFQIYVDGDYIDGQMYQRSGDMFLGVPFNIASYSFLLHIIGKITDKIPRFLYHILGDCHIYSNHYNEVETQLKRHTYKFPTLEINGDIIDIDNINESQFKINNYNSHPPLKAEMIA